MISRCYNNVLLYNSNEHIINIFVNIIDVLFMLNRYYI